jgi:hypothetical protein
MRCGDSIGSPVDWLALLSFAFSLTTDITTGKPPGPPFNAAPSSLVICGFLSYPRNLRNPRFVFSAFATFTAKEQQGISNRG